LHVTPSSIYELNAEKTHETGERITTFIESFTSKVPSNEMGKQNYAIT
jgi:hypothetical protein